MLEVKKSWKESGASHAFRVLGQSIESPHGTTDGTDNTDLEFYYPCHLRHPWLIQPDKGGVAGG